MNDVLLVDDELAVLGSLRNAVNWTEYGFRNVHTAQSGQQALRLMAEHPIDLLITDIMMNGMSGLEMVHTVRGRHPNVHCVIISAHGKFEYCREALRLGVENFLLKPIDLNELQETVYRAAENIAREGGVTRDLFARNVLERWLYGRISSDELIERSAYAGYNVLLRQYCAVAVQAQGMAERMVQRIARGMGVDQCAYPLTLDEHHGVVLVGGRDIQLEVIRQEAAQQLRNHPGMRIACGSVVVGSSNVFRSMTEAERVMAFARMSGRQGLLEYGTVDWSLLRGDDAALLEEMASGMPNLQAVENWTREAAKACIARGGELRDLYALICMQLSRVTEESAPEKRKLPFAPFHPPYNADSFCQAVQGTLRALGEFNLRSEQNLTPVVRRMIDYINKNLNSALSLKHFSEQTSMNATYVGRLFKEETGMYFSDYVCHKRISRARHLLETTSLPVGDIGRQVGIYDVSYFTQCFKKQIGLSPMKYKQQFRQKTEKT